MGEAFVNVGDHWNDDAFERKSYASFLTRYLVGKVVGAGMSAELKPFTMALDANWGSGKTFFLQRWSQDLQTKRPDEHTHTVVSFDAWAADYADDPLVAFMSELRLEMQRALKASGLKPAIRNKALKAVDSATKKIRHLVLPVTGLVVKGVLHKASGIDVDEIVDALGANSAVNGGAGGAELGDVVPMDKAEAALDRLFEVQLDEHTKRKNSIAEFKADLAIALKALQSKEGAAAPLFVMVDELDRCKPSFAVGLLEAIKHIFGVPGVCVVIATNADQLAHTVKAVYGEGFDARTYLQRFFDAIYALPVASGSQQLGIWLRERPVFSNDRCCWAIPGRGFAEDQYGKGPAGMLAWIFQGMDLSLRAQSQVIELMEAAALGLPPDRRVHVPWLALVCSLWHSYRDAFTGLEGFARGNNSADSIWNALGVGAASRQYEAYSYDGKRMNQVISLKDLSNAYSTIAARDLVEMRRTNRESASFSAVVQEEVLKDAPNSYNAALAYPVGLVGYFEIARTAGHMRLR